MIFSPNTRICHGIINTTYCYIWVREWMHMADVSSSKLPPPLPCLYCQYQSQISNVKRQAISKTVVIHVMTGGRLWKPAQGCSLLGKHVRRMCSLLFWPKCVITFLYAVINARLVIVFQYGSYSWNYSYMCVYIYTMNKLRMTSDKTSSLYWVLYDCIKLLLCFHIVVSDTLQPMLGHH